MRVLVTGGTGVVGKAAVTALLAHGHEVRLLSRHAERDARAWPEGVEPHRGDVGDPESVAGAADGCDAVLHLVGIVAEHPPEVTFERINVRGTEAIVREAARAGVPRLVFVSSLGAERGTSDYHRSKRRAEEIVRGYRGDWTICRPGSVYGGGDEEVSMVLRLVRTLPVVPLFGNGDQQFQPIWHEDLGEALARVVERDDLSGRVLELAGPDRTSQRDLVERFSRLTGRSPAVVPVPEFLTTLGARAANLVGAGAPLDENQLVMIREGNVIPDDRPNALVDECGLVPTRLDEGLRLLADAQPEVLPHEGVGVLHRKRFWALIEGARLDARGLMRYLRTNPAHVLPGDTGAETGGLDHLTLGATLTLGLPLRGNIQVRVEEETDRSATLATVAGHPLAGAVRFVFADTATGVLAELQVFDRAASIPDWIAMRTLGDTMQNAAWTGALTKLIDASGGRAPDGVHTETEELEGDELARVEEWIAELVLRRERQENAATLGVRDPEAGRPGLQPPMR